LLTCWDEIGKGHVTVELEHAVLVAAAPSVVFDLARDIDLHLESQAAAGERAVAGTTAGLIGLGEHVTWRATHFGVPFTMTSRVTELERPNRFIDEQVRGPFRWWRHEHRFEPVGDGTRMVDRVDFAAPLGPIGWCSERLVLERYLQRLIADRADHLCAVAEARS
jgi:ligand-binding SRPBCC domain-containing protein